jgi:type I restriction enzyme R subunit
VNAVDLNFIRGQFTEAELESAIIGLFQEQDYDYVLGETIHRGFDEILLKDDLRSFLAAQYPDLTVVETDKVIGKLENIPPAPLYLGNREAFLLVNDGFDLQRDAPSVRETRD